MLPFYSEKPRPKMKYSKVSKWLLKTNDFYFSLYAIIASFSTYACMYAFRKPFTVASFAGLEVFGLDYKTLLVITQVIGYTTSKFIGIKIVSEMSPSKRVAAILLLIVISEISLLLFAVVPYPYNFIFMFFNGLPLGMVWGLVFSFLEGRRLTEILGAGLSVSFIVASGFVKSIGKIVMSEFGVSEFLMPFVTGLLFAVPLLLSVWLLSRIPRPTKEDEILRTKRVPMNKQERLKFFMKFSVGIIMLTLVYMTLTAFRDMRDNFVADIWIELGYNDLPMIFTYTEIPIAIIVLAIMGSLMLIKNNMKALLINHFVILLGILIIGGSTFAFQVGIISAPIWIVLTGLGLYMGYVPFNCILFDRFIATYKTAANAGFLIYIADSFGYLSSVGVMFYKNLGFASISWYEFFMKASYVMLFLGGPLTVISIIYFYKKSKMLIESKDEIMFSNNVSNKVSEVF